MMNAFETLGIAITPVLDELTLREAFREAGKSAHPDGGGTDSTFAGLRAAFDTLSSPSKRLRHWLELRGIPVEPRGTVDPELMDLFSKIGEVTQHAEVVIRKRGETKSALALAMTEREAQTCRDQVEQALSQVEAAIARECSRFPIYQKSPDAEGGSMAVRNLGFLEKWRTSLRAVFSRLT